MRPLHLAAVYKRIHFVGDKLNVYEHAQRVIVHCFRVGERLGKVARIVVYVLYKIAFVYGFARRGIFDNLYLLVVALAFHDRIGDGVWLYISDFLL